MREKLFWNLFAKRYSKNKVSNMKGYNHTLNVTKKYLKKSHKVLEVGCGTGTTALTLSKHIKSYVASDISANMSKIGKEKVKKAKVRNVKFHTGTIFSDKLKEKSFDVVMAHNLIHLVKDRDELMRRANELLKPGGLFISKTPCLAERKSMKVIAVFATVLVGPLKCFTLKQNRESLRKAGFEIVKEHIYKSENPPRTLIIAKKK